MKLNKALIAITLCAATVSSSANAQSVDYDQILRAYFGSSVEDNMKQQDSGLYTRLFGTITALLALSPQN